MPSVESFDVVIIGGGPAGVSCSLELQDYSVRHCLVEKSHELGGQLPLITGKIRNFAGLSFKNGTVLQNTLIRTANEVNLPCRLNDEVVACDLNFKTVKTTHGSLMAKTLVLATGARLRKMTVAQGAHLNSQIIYKIEDKTEEIMGQAVVVAGEGDDAIATALLLCKRAAHITVISAKQNLAARPHLLKEMERKRNIDVLLNMEISKLLGDSAIEGIQIEDRETHEMSELFTPFVIARTGWTANCEMFNGQLEMTAERYIEVDRFMQTSKPGVFAIGDLTHPSYRRIGAASGQGITAAQAILRYLASLD
jgi:thioredoxin reductase (NADPH)